MRYAYQYIIVVALSIAVGLGLAMWLVTKPAGPRFPFSECTDYAPGQPPASCEALAPLLILTAVTLLSLAVIKAYQWHRKIGKP